MYIVPSLLENPFSSSFLIFFSAMLFFSFPFLYFTFFTLFLFFSFLFFFFPNLSKIACEPSYLGLVCYFFRVIYEVDKAIVSFLISGDPWSGKIPEGFWYL